MSTGLVHNGPVTYRAVNPPDVRPAVAAQPRFEHVGLLTKMQRLRRELGNWRRAGYPLTPRAERKRRDAICAACEYFNKGGNLGLGECLAPGCGCSRAKTLLATSRCPLPQPKWQAVPPSGEKIGPILP